MSWAERAVEEAAGLVLRGVSPGLRPPVLETLADLSTPEVVASLNRLGRDAVRVGVAELTSGSGSTAESVVKVARRYSTGAEVLAALRSATEEDERAAQLEQDWSAVLGAAGRFSTSIGMAALGLLASVA